MKPCSNSQSQMQNQYKLLHIMGQKKKNFWTSIVTWCNKSQVWQPQPGTEEGGSGLEWDKTGKASGWWEGVGENGREDGRTGGREGPREGPEKLRLIINPRTVVGGTVEVDIYIMYLYFYIYGCTYIDRNMGSQLWKGPTIIRMRRITISTWDLLYLIWWITAFHVKVSFSSRPKKKKKKN